MSAPAFTPGPWQRKHDYTKEGACTIVANVDGEIHSDGTTTHSYDFICTCEDEYGEYAERAEANARLIAAAPDYATACGLDLDPGEAQSCGPLAWFESAIDALGEDAVREAAQGDDPDAYFTMLTECRLLLEKLEAANAKARGEQ